MTLRHYILILSDTPDLESGAVRYGMELAHRTGAVMATILVLMENTDAGSIKEIAQAIVTQHVARPGQPAIEGEALVRVGPPRTELLKHLAEEGTPEAIVWAGQVGGYESKDHWLRRMKNDLGCPVVVHVSKNVNTNNN